MPTIPGVSVGQVKKLILSAVVVAGAVRDALDVRTKTISDPRYAVKLLNGSPQVRTMPDAPAMATPPTVTASASAHAGFTRTIRPLSSQTNYWSGFRVSGAPLFANGANSAYPRGARKTNDAVNNFGGAERYEFDLTSDAFVVVCTAPASSAFKVWADERPAAVQMTALGSVTGVSGTGQHYFKVDFGSSAKRRIVFEHAALPANPSNLVAFQFRPTAVVTPPSIPSPRFMVIGDSYSYGIGATDVGDSFAVQLGRYLGFGAIFNFTAVPSTGVLAADGANTLGAYNTRFATDVIPYMRAGDVLVYQGSVNDGGQAAGATQTQAIADLTALKAALPNTHIVVTSPLYMTTPLAAHTRLRDEMSAAAAAVGLPFVNLLDTDLAMWFGTGTTGSPTGDGPADTLAVNVGGIHPTSAGAKSLAYRSAKLIGEALGQTSQGAASLAADLATKASQTDMNSQWLPSDLALKAWAFDPALIANVGIPPAGTLTLSRLKWQRGATLSGLVVHVGTAGAGLVSGQCFIAAYDSNLNLLGVSASQHTNWQTTGMKGVGLVTPAANVQSDTILVAVYWNGTTGPAFSRGGNSQGVNGGLSAFRFATADTGLTAAPPAVAAALTATGMAYWAAAS